MAEKRLFEDTPLHPASETDLQTMRAKMDAHCTRCGVCLQDCAFLTKHGTPGELARSYDPSRKMFQDFAFECSLCRLCVAVCPEALDPVEMFLEMRREKMRRDPRGFPEHKGYLAYEKRGSSKRYSYYALPENCTCIFFPGCTLAGTRSDKTFKIYKHLQAHMPNLGIVLDCCMKISHDLGRQDYFIQMFREMNDFLTRHHIRQVLVACPNCHRIFKSYAKDLTVSTIYETLDAQALPVEEKTTGRVSIHDPCPLRFETQVQASIRRLVAKTGLSVQEMAHRGENTLCCGEGGFVACRSPELSSKWAQMRKSEALEKRIITYCAGCSNHLNAHTPASHIVDLLWEPDATMAGKVPSTRSPLTYLKRLGLKRKLRNTVCAAVTRERTFSVQKKIK